MKSADPSPKSKPEVIVRCEVLAPSLVCGGGTAAKGARVNLKQSAAEFHEKRGEVRVLGTK